MSLNHCSGTFLARCDQNHGAIGSLSCQGCDLQTLGSVLINHYLYWYLQQELEEDADMRSRVALFKAEQQRQAAQQQPADQQQPAATSDDDDFPEVTL